MTIGEKIRCIRKRKGLTQKGLAEKSGIAEITIRQYEADKYKPKPDAIMKLCFALDCKTTDLIDDDNQKYYRMFDEILKNAHSLVNSANTEDELDKAEKLLTDAEKLYQEEYPLNIRLQASFELLNNAGKEKAVTYVEDLSKIPEYQDWEEIEKSSQHK